METAFWDILDEIADDQDMTTPRFLSTLYDEVLELNGKISNFTSLLRVACVLYLQRPQALPQVAERGFNEIVRGVEIESLGLVVLKNET